MEVVKETSCALAEHQYEPRYWNFMFDVVLPPRVVPATPLSLAGQVAARQARIQRAMDAIALPGVPTGRRWSTYFEGLAPDDVTGQINIRRYYGNGEERPTDDRIPRAEFERVFGKSLRAWVEQARVSSEG